MKKQFFSPKDAAEITDFLTVTKEDIRRQPPAYLDSMADCLEDWNAHSENLVLFALRHGTDEQIEEARAILTGHQAAGELTPDLSTRRYRLYKEIESQLPYVAPKDLQSLLAEMASALHCLSMEEDFSVAHPLRKKYRAMALEAYNHITA
jgi:hypothetical protein